MLPKYQTPKPIQEMPKPKPIVTVPEVIIPEEIPVVEEMPMPEEEPVIEEMPMPEPYCLNMPANYSNMPVNYPNMMSNCPYLNPVMQSPCTNCPMNVNEMMMPTYGDYPMNVANTNYPIQVANPVNIYEDGCPNCGMGGYESWMGRPAAIISDNPAVIRFTAFKELNGYPNYGNPSRNADILYTGNRGTWTLDLPASFAAVTGTRAQITLRSVLDDHTNVPVNRYSANIQINGQMVHSGRLNLPHGRPVGGMFNNWVSLTYNINLRRNNRIVITNTSTTGPDDWFAIDWMEIRLR